MAAWASSRRPAPPSICATPASSPIYEGTNGIQAIDLVTRKLPLAGGRHGAGSDRRHARRGATRLLQGAIRPSATPRRGCATASRASTGRRASSLKALATNRPDDGARRARRPICACSASRRAAPALRQAALAASAALRAGETDPAHAARIAPGAFFAENLLTAAGGLEESVIDGGAFTQDAALAWLVEGRAIRLPCAVNGASRMGGGRGDRDLSEQTSAPLSRPATRATLSRRGDRDGANRLGQGTIQ